MSASWKEVATLGIGAAAAIGAGLTAYATLRLLGIQHRAAKAGRPTLADLRISKSKTSEKPHEIEFRIDNEYLTTWRIISVSAHPLWRPLISEIGSMERDKSGELFVAAAKKWTRKIQYDPPTASTTILLRYDCPSRVGLVFKLAMRASPNETSLFTTRIKIRD